jgi:hypothetical protein
MNNIEIVWLSLDPIRKKIDYYPKIIAERIEKEFNKNSNNFCVLGKDFYNATIHFDDTLNYYQTTPGFQMGRYGFKQPGCRSVRRIIVPNNKIITINTKLVNGELRIINDKNYSLLNFTETIPINCIINVNNSGTMNEINTWKSEDLELKQDNLHKNVVIWQWCRGVPEKQGNLMHLSDDWWIPYLFEQNNLIENAFNKKELNTIISLPYDNTKRKIEFIYNSVFGKQTDIINKKQRLIRRKIVTVQELINLINEVKNNQFDVSILNTLISNNEIPHEFFCCISQDIMDDPVKTSDGFTYNRISIEKWFENSNKSPLTGLYLYNTSLEPNTIIKKQIQDFVEFKIKENNNK